MIHYVCEHCSKTWTTTISGVSGSEPVFIRRICEYHGRMLTEQNERNSEQNRWQLWKELM